LENALPLAGFTPPPLQQIRAAWPVQVIPEACHLNCIFPPEFKNGMKDWLDRQAQH
jgi:hypothetical protein